MLGLALGMIVFLAPCFCSGCGYVQRDPSEPSQGDRPEWGTLFESKEEYDEGWEAFQRVVDPRYKVLVVTGGELNGGDVIPPTMVAWNELPEPADELPGQSHYRYAATWSVAVEAWRDEAEGQVGVRINVHDKKEGWKRTVAASLDATDWLAVGEVIRVAGPQRHTFVFVAQLVVDEEVRRAALGVPAHAEKGE